MSNKDINSQDYWEQRFREDWNELGGPEQSRFFTRVALTNFPGWLRHAIATSELTICDWGCAEGSGTAELASGLTVPVTGIDFSVEAVERAATAHPHIQFMCRDLMKEGMPQYDIVFSSNTLEHFQEPWRVFERLCEFAMMHVVLLLPYEEYQRISEHFATFDADGVTFARGEFVLTHAAIEDVSSHQPCYWPGKQILAVYTRQSALKRSGITLGNLRIDSRPIELMLRDVAVDRYDALSGLVAELEQRLSAEKDRSHALSEACSTAEGRLMHANEQNSQHHAESVHMRGELAKLQAQASVLRHSHAELSLIKSSRSWRWTKPIRVLMRSLRHRGLAPEDREQFLRRFKRARHVTGLSQPAKITRIPDAVRLASQAEGKPDVYVWSVIDWHFRIQRPQHLARELAAAGYRVFYISNNFIDLDEPGFAIEPLDDCACLFQIKLHLKGSPGIYHAIPTPDAQQQLRAGIGQLLASARSRSCLSLVQHPYWLETARVLPNQRLIYDCMDHHGGFANNSPEVLARELDLMRTADLLVVTSDWLYEEAGKYNSRRLMVRNACQYEHFVTRPESVFRDKLGRKVIGYYGAIAEWFDLDLLEKVAQRFADCLVLMVGADTTGARQRLQHLANVQFTGEVPYAELPFYLHGFDVCLLPFQVIPLTLATNPVKIYEYLSAGKEVVSIALPEIRQFGELVRTGSDHVSFLTALGDALATESSPVAIARRQQFAADQTWGHRVRDLMQGVDALPEPRVSVVVVTYNNLDLTKACLRSLDLYSDYANLEVIVVDNASSDGTPDYLMEWAAAGKDRRLILNPDNRGFAAANNQGLAIADGDYLALLNNDTHVTPGWVATLIAHLRRSKALGMIGPVTNNIGNEARIDISYTDMDGMLNVAAEYTAHHAGQLTPLRTAAFFCVMMPRAVYEKVGPLDEAFGIGFFEDDDYCRRVEQAGWAIACADDVFVHHNLSASFNKLKLETRQALFEQNKSVYEAKWGAWSPHKHRET